jgi:hypothetical protein
MRKLHKAAFVGAVLGSVGTLGVGTASAHGEAMAHDFDITQGIECRSHDLNSVLANALNGEGSPGAQPSHLGSDMGCNSAVK